MSRPFILSFDDARPKPTCESLWNERLKYRSSIGQSGDFLADNLEELVQIASAESTFLHLEDHPDDVDSDDEYLGDLYELGFPACLGAQDTYD